MLIKKIADVIKKSLTDFDEEKMQAMMLKHYRLLHLIDHDEKWATPRLQMISSDLLPGNLTAEKINIFIDDIVFCAEQNPYLVKFLKTAENEKFEHLSDKVKSEGKDVFPDVAAYSIVLECLTKAIYKDNKILEDCIATFGKAMKSDNAFKYLPLFHKIKFISVDVVMKKSISAHNAGIMYHKGLKYSLPVNIFEAVISDYLRGFKDNAMVGWILAKNGFGAKKYNPLTGEGPSHWSDDRKTICRQLRLNKEWDDLYQTWNMAFCAKMPDFPYIIPKLLIPQVAAYQKKPGEYMANRSNALYLYLIYSSFDYVNKARSREHGIQWADGKLTRLWGRSNKEAGEQYLSELAGRSKI